MKNTVLTPVHIQFGAKMVPFAGYNMPVQYSGIGLEHNAVRNAVGVFDVSHMGEFIVRGEYAIDLLQYITTNDVSKLEIGQIQYSCMPNYDGGIVDDLLIYRLSQNSYMLVVNASNIEKDWRWLIVNNRWDIQLLNISETTSLLAVQGPHAIDTLQKLTHTDLSNIPYYHFQKVEMHGIQDILVSNTGYTGAGGFELYIDNSIAVILWNAILAAGAEFNIQPAGLGARDTLRLEMGYCLYGNDIDDSTSPLEAGLSWITKFSKDFIAKFIFENQKQTGMQKKLVGFEMIDKGIPRHGYLLMDNNQNLIGKVTSGTQSPTLKKGIGMGYVDKDFSKPNTEILVEIRGQRLGAKVCSLPFVASKVK